VRLSCDAEKLKISPGGGDYGRRKCRRGYTCAYGEVRRNLRLTEVWRMESGGWFCISVFGRNVASVAVKIFAKLICTIKVYKFRVFNETWKANAETNCITFQNKNCSFPSTSTCYTTLLLMFMFMSKVCDYCL
jgi:hypothetical protein